MERSSPGPLAGRSSLHCLVSRLRWPQQALIHAFQQLFPEDFFANFDFPYVEDLVNAPPFTTYLDWCDSHGFPPGAPQPPLRISKSLARKSRAGEGVQLGAFSQRSAFNSNSWMRRWLGCYQ